MKEMMADEDDWLSYEIDLQAEAKINLLKSS